MPRSHLCAMQRVGLLCAIGTFSAIGASAAAPPPSGNWEHAGSGPPGARADHMMAYDSARQVVVLFGGATPQGESNQTWEWNGVAWSQRFPAHSPPAASLAAMVYDDARDRTVLLAGATWEWNGSDWTERPTNPAPGGGRYGHAMAYDAARNRVVLFGGWLGGFRADDTWVFDGTTWVQMSPSVRPTARAHHVMAYDASVQRVVMIGGDVEPGGDRDATWEWDGTTWLLRSSSYPGASAALLGASMVYDASRQRSQLLTSYTCSPNPQPLFEWDSPSGVWLDRQRNLPAVMHNHRAAFDESRSTLVLFGGRVFSESCLTLGMLSTTWVLGGSLSIDADPQSRTGVYGQAASFSINASGAGPLTYRWRKNGIDLFDGGNIVGASTSTLMISTIGDSDAAAYDAVVSNPYGSVRSNPASLTPVPVCPADFNRSGQVGSQDIFDFLAAFFSPCP